MQPDDETRFDQLLEEIRVVRERLAKKGQESVDLSSVSPETLAYAEEKGMTVIGHDLDGYNLLHWAANDMLRLPLFDVVMDLIKGLCFFFFNMRIPNLLLAPSYFMVLPTSSEGPAKHTTLFLSREKIVMGREKLFFNREKLFLSREKPFSSRVK